MLTAIMFPDNSHHNFSISGILNFRQGISPSDSSLPIAAKVIEVLSPENLKENACDRNHSYQ
jgi:hypothetical protein